ncbi:DNA-binding response regulator, LytR/AlgR family [Tenacibaculum sp. MAR_2009_124]|uniref:LytR/AlgR family response regulator transcription factor n=1 Tax=Tenacibaculum sp. MAR_2009_124 TaxID=1250059 RepID=UPI00089CB0E3|nr:LytTR family DNA-binding domain-containing protein [Tenacibaculum sp. MAR_2009_124]SEB67866.1 DNA-binding response regulator, LytR/AlgR family [Tenacibaculum sp. MAR_2009_124]
MNKQVNCIIIDDEPMAREILTTYIDKIPNLNLLKSCSSAMDGIHAINDHAIDLVFLDINMPEISGLTFAKSIQKNIKIVFTTAYREYAVEGFDLQAIDYLLKPIAFDRFLRAVNKLLETSNLVKEVKPKLYSNLNQTNDFIFLRSDRKMIKMDFSDILYVESLSDYVKVHTASKTIVTRETISNIENKLPNHYFIRVHRSFIVSIKQIVSYTNEYIEINKKAVPISRTYKEEVLQKLGSI